MIRLDFTHEMKKLLFQVEELKVYEKWIEILNSIGHCWENSSEGRTGVTCSIEDLTLTCNDKDTKKDVLIFCNKYLFNNPKITITKNLYLSGKWLKIKIVSTAPPLNFPTMFAYIYFSENVCLAVRQELLKVDILNTIN